MTDVPRVVSLRGEAYSQPGEPNPSVIKQLESLLELARNGQINGVAFVSHWSDLSGIGHCQAGHVSYSMVGKLELLKSQMLKTLSE
jgi:hypothetical protein